MSDPTHVISYELLQIQENLSYEEMQMRIMDHKEKSLRTKIFPLVNVSWQNQRIEEASWELEQEMCNKFPELFENRNCFHDLLSDFTSLSSCIKGKQNFTC
jgi:uncharacterized protein YigA (DUF484 family)